MLTYTYNILFRCAQLITQFNNPKSTKLLLILVPNYKHIYLFEQNCVETSIYYVLINFIIDKQYKVISYQKDEYVIDTYIFVWDAL